MSFLLINEDSLIALVQQNDLLYNKANKEYKNTQKKKEVWEAIGLEIGATGDACYKRWTSLRDKYCREVRRMACSSGSGAITETKWQHFESLSFLNGHMRGGRQRSNFSFQTENMQCLEESELFSASTPLNSPVLAMTPSPSPVLVTTPSPSPVLVTTPSPSPVFTPVGFTEPCAPTSSQPRKRRREVAHDEQTVAFMEITKTMKSFLEKEEAPADMRAHSFGKFVESCLTGMEERKQMSLIGDITQMLIAAQTKN